jgi:hypothetical protein
LVRVLRLQAERALANHAEVGAGGVAQFLGLLGVAAGTGFGAFHQVMGHAIDGGHAGGGRQETGDLGKQAVLSKVTRQGVKSWRWIKNKGFP